MTTNDIDAIPGPPELTDEQRTVLSLVAEGHTASQIGDRIGMPTGTVQNVLSRMYRQLGARNAPHAVAIAMRTGGFPVDAQLAAERARTQETHQ